jgi:pyrroline-5-carboxylate reductase
MAQALLLPLIDAGVLQAGEVRAVVGRAASAQELAQVHGLAVSCDAREAWRCPTVLLAVKPQQLEVVAAAAASLVRSQPESSLGASKEAGTGEGAGEAPLLISVLAGVTLARLERLFPGWRCVRAVPNTPCLVRAGLTGLAWGAGVGPERQEWVRGLFARVGEVLELPESQLDAFLALTSSGPAFVALVAEAMADGAVAAGLPRGQAQHLAHRTLAGTAALLHEQDLHPGQLKDMVSSPGGTTIAGLRQLEKAGVRSALIEAVVAAAARSRELG